jgi:hypothetical protein
MGLRPTHEDESALLRFIDSKQVTRDFRGSVIACNITCRYVRPSWRNGFRLTSMFALVWQSGFYR